MARHVALLRGINVGGHRKVPMADLRAALTRAGCEDVATYVQSGNVVLAPAPGATTDDTAERVVAVLASAFDLDDVPVLVRDLDALEALVADDPFAAVRGDDDGKLHHVLFLGGPVDLADALAPVDPDRLEVSASGLELHLWTPAGIRDSALARSLTDRRLGTTVTARNWRTVTKLLALARGGA